MSKILPDKSWTLREIRESLLTYARGKLFAEWCAQQQVAWELVNNPLDTWLQKWGDNGTDPKTVTDVRLYLDNWKYKREVDDIHDSIESILKGTDDAEPFWEPQKRLTPNDIDITDAEWLQPARIVKRDGRTVPFTLGSIIDVIRAAAIASKASLTPLDLSSAATLASARLYEQAVADRMEYSWDPTQLYYIGPVADLETTVEACQDEVERALIDLGFSEVAKAYILYRDARTRAREMKQEENKLVDELVNISAEDNDEARENANVNANSTMGSLLKIGEATLKAYALRKHLISPKFAEMFKQGIIHIHDLALGCLTINCIFIPLAKLSRHGFSTGHGFLRPPATIGSAATQTCVVIQASQNDFLGGQAIASFDYDLAKYVAKSYVRNVARYIDTVAHALDEEVGAKEILVPELDRYLDEHEHILTPEGANLVKNKLAELIEEHHLGNTLRYEKVHEAAYAQTDRDTYQAMEALIHNLCTLSTRSGAQVPFSSVNLGTDTSEEGRMVTRNFLLATDAGLGAGETAIFPISIFRLLDGTNTKKGDPNYDLFQLACKVSARRSFPNFVNIDAPFNYKYYKPGHPETEVGSMGCYQYDTTIIVQKGDETKVVKIGDFVDASDALEWKVWDSYQQRFVKILNVVKNPPSDEWYHIRLSDGHEVTITGDHRVDIRGGRIFFARGIGVGWTLLVGKASPEEPNQCSWVTICEHTPLDMVAPSYCLTTESDRFDANGLCLHNCRTRTISNIYDPEHEQTSGRGNLFFNTINLPYLALLAKERCGANASSDTVYAEFMEVVDQTIDDCIDLCKERFEIAARRHAYNYPFSFGQYEYVTSEKLKPEDSIREVIKQGTQTVGFIGLAETLVALFGKHHGESYESQQKGLEIIKHMNDRIADYAQKEHVNYSFMATPAEGCAGKLLRKTRDRFGIVPGVTDKEYFTNSFMVPPRYEISAYDKVDIEAPYHELCPGGSISYIELPGSITNNPEAFEELVLYMKHAGMGYFSINHPLDRCPVCGSVLAEIGDTCPVCGRRENEGVPLKDLLKIPGFKLRPDQLRDLGLTEEEERQLLEEINSVRNGF